MWSVTMCLLWKYFILSWSDGKSTGESAVSGDEERLVLLKKEIVYHLFISHK